MVQRKKILIQVVQRKVLIHVVQSKSIRVLIETASPWIDNDISLSDTEVDNSDSDS